MKYITLTAVFVGFGLLSSWIEHINISTKAVIIGLIVCLFISIIILIINYINKRVTTK